MAYHLEDTIAAIASPPGGGARGIVRLSGRQTVAVAAAVFRAASGDLESCRRATAFDGHVRLERLGRDLPARLYLWPTQRSYTREPAAEIHTIGSAPLLNAALAELVAAGARPAEPGEFTLRAFLAGRIDLTQAEAVLGVIDARGPRDLGVALAQMAGGLAGPLGRLRGDLLDLLARLEAGLDFAEEDIEFISRTEIDDQIDRAQAVLGQLAAQMQARSRADDVVRAVLAGPPNAGKSSLFNALAAAAALVSSRPGTTRDYLVARLDLAGLACDLVDTAGIDSAPFDGTIAAQAQEQSAAEFERADIKLICLEAGQSPNAWHRARLAELDPRTQLIVVTKLDVHDGWQLPAKLPADSTLATSARTGVGLARLLARLRSLAVDSEPADSRVVAATASRAAASVLGATQALSRAKESNASGAGDELVAAELRSALDDLGHVSGAVATDDLLDRIFSRFCIGK